MSEIYKRKLGRIQDERDTAEEMAAYVRDNWYTKSLFNEAGFDGRTLDGIIQLAESLDTIFSIRLFAAFEGILQEHTIQGHIFQNLQVRRSSLMPLQQPRRQGSA